MRKLALLTLATFAALAVASEVISVKIPDLIAKPGDFDKKEVKVSGKVAKFEQRTSKAGNEYFVFRVEEGKKWVSIYGRGKLVPPLKDEASVEVTGTFSKEKKLGRNVFKNEIETTPKQVKPLLAK